jgi:hypothetical protein
MLTIPGHKRNANENHTKILSHSCTIKNTITSVGEGNTQQQMLWGEKDSYTASGNVS